LDFIGLPAAVGVEVVQRKEGGGVEGVGVVFLWERESVVISGQRSIGRIHTGHVLLHPSRVVVDYGLLRRAAAAAAAVVPVGEGTPCHARRDDYPGKAHVVYKPAQISVQAVCSSAVVESLLRRRCLSDAKTPETQFWGPTAQTTEAVRCAAARPGDDRDPGCTIRRHHSATNSAGSSGRSVRSI
jgi:hypothetical protein